MVFENEGGPRGQASRLASGRRPHRPRICRPRFCWLRICWLRICRPRVCWSRVRSGAAIGSVLVAACAALPAAPLGNGPASGRVVAQSVDATLDFSAWLSELRAEGLARGIRAETLDRALADVEPIARVIELDRNQPEFKLTYREYMERVMPSARIERGRRLLAQERPLLDRIQREYGVAPHVIVALWGIESDFGRIQGGFRVIPALATLAYDGRRGSYFRGELIDALHILDEGHVEVDSLVGSWAGALGQCQFMPSSFRRHAVDFDGDGRRDIWGTRADVFASAANYLAQAGWQPAYRWGRAVRLPDSFDRSLAELAIKKTLTEWQSLGVRRLDGGDLPTAPGLRASIVIHDDGQGPAFLVYPNFEAIMTWNRSVLFATAVGLLADRIAADAGE
jgi:membrane-bound lytic murein transglycosylase B